MTVWVIEIGDGELVELAAPTFLEAVLTLARARPGVHIQRFVGCYTKHGEA